MKILLITSSYTATGNSAAIRHNALVKGLILNGCDVDVFTVRWPKESSSNFFLNEGNGNLYYSDLPAISSNAGLRKKYQNKKNRVFDLIKGFVKSVLYYPDVCYQWKSIVKVDNPAKYDFMISSSFTNSSHFAAHEIKKLFPSMFWIQVWGDPWYYDDLITPWYLKPFVLLDENRLLKSANRIVYISRVTSDLMKSKRKFIDNKTSYIPRSFYFEVCKTSKTQSNNYSITYAGNITSSTGRNILAFISAIEVYNSLNEARISVNIYAPVIDVAMKDELLLKSFVNVNDGVDFDEIPDIYSKSDALLFISNKGGTSMIPGKLYDYLGTDLPVICLMSDITDAVSTFIKGFGEKCIMMENEFDKISVKLPQIVTAMSKTFPVVEDYSPKVVAKRYMDLYVDHNA